MTTRNAKGKDKGKNAWVLRYAQNDKQKQKQKESLHKFCIHSLID
jgi:hypothetical protein